MERPHEFGGSWTQDKLERLSGYLSAYMRILRNQPWATTIYVDAFAGTGSIQPTSNLTSSDDNIVIDEARITGFLDGSARIALSTPTPFDRYLFVERNSANVRHLERLRADFPDLSDRIDIVRADANDYLINWIRITDWTKTRAVVFLDPYGMQVQWRLLEQISKTRAIDLWLLVPIGMGANRVMTQSNLPPPGWQDKLTSFFGTEEWKQRFYRTPVQAELFGDGPDLEKAANYDDLAAYFVERLKLLFGNDGVAPNPLTQRNSRNSPMFLLCFASANKNGVKIADWLLSNKPKRKEDH